MKKLMESRSISGWFWQDYQSRCPGPDAYRLQVLAKEGMMHMETGGKHLIMITSDEISNPF